MKTSEKNPKKSSAGLSKMAMATKAYERMRKVEGVKRKEIIEEFVNNCGLTPAGAATYYTLIRKKWSKNNRTA
ncbi:hypothetical protein ACJJID_19435 [Microbulbifer sp. CnH-101-G]|uniref:hypothetical protein n=1 Tax=Microbulbifer sp. CnH-101-G TaxID=3243393 RepID=UPI0040391BCC